MKLVDVGVASKENAHRAKRQFAQPENFLGFRAAPRHQKHFTMRIALCGSMVFIERMLEAKRRLEASGHEVFVSGFIEEYIGKNEKEIEALTIYDKSKRDAIREFYAKIKKSDAVLVLNYDRRGIKNYIGGNTLMEIGFAYVLKKQIFLLNPIPDILYYKSEIEAVQPIILNGALSKIPKSRPKTEAREIESIVGAVIVNEKGEILLVTGPKWQGYYTIVGGHIECGEPIAQAVKRELQEEIGTAPRRLEFLTVNEAINPAWYHRPAHFIFINYVGWVHQKEVTICAREFTEHLWIKPKRALREVRLAPSAPKVIEAYRERYERTGST